MKAEKIFITIVSPLILVAVLYFGYRIADTFFFRSLDGEVRVSIPGRSNVNPIKNCELRVLDGYGYRMVIADAQGNGLQVDRSESGQLSAVSLMDWRALEDATCVLAGTDLTLAYFNPRPSRTSSAIRSWKGELQAVCRMNKGEIAIKAKLHACR